MSIFGNLFAKKNDEGRGGCCDARIDKAVRVEYVTDLAEIAAAGVMSTPAIVIGGTIASFGKLLSTSEIETLIDQKANA